MYLPGIVTPGEPPLSSGSHDEQGEEFPGQALRVSLSASEAVVRRTVLLPLDVGIGRTVEAWLSSFDALCDGGEHVLVRVGHQWGIPLVRVHSECLTGDSFGSLRCDCGPQLRESLRKIHERGGALVYLRQEGRGIGLYNKIDAYGLQDAGMDTFAANTALGFEADARDYTVAAEILHVAGLNRIDLLSNNPDKAEQLRQHGIDVVHVIHTDTHCNPHNSRYLAAKIAVTRHNIDMKGALS
jgi:GTP cyclohydrolase II